MNFLMLFILLESDVGHMCALALGQFVLQPPRRRNRRHSLQFPSSHLGAFTLFSATWGYIIFLYFSVVNLNSLG